MTWVPVCVISFISFSDDDELLVDGGEIYKVAAIVLLPINSAMNPFLYSSVLPNFCKRLFCRTGKLRKKNPKFGSVDTLSATKSTADYL